MLSQGYISLNKTKNYFYLTFGMKELFLLQFEYILTNLIGPYNFNLSAK